MTNYLLCFLKKTFLPCFILFFPVLIFSQNTNYSFKHLNKVEGLSNNFVTKVLEDSYGFIWIATSDGLNRWDSRDFKIFKYNPNSNNSIAYNFILDIAEDANKNLWIGTNQNGLCRYNLQEQIFYRYKTDKADSTAIQSFVVRKIFVDSDNNVWIATNSGLSRYISLTDNFKRYKFPDNTFHKDITNIYQCNPENILVQASGKLYSINIKTGNTELLNFYIESKEIPFDFSEYNILFDTQNNMWIGTTKGLYKFNIKTQITKKYLYSSQNATTISSNDISVIYQDSKKNIWIGTKNNGINLYNPVNDNFTRYASNKFYSTALSNNIITNIYEDSNKTLWISTQEGGVNIISLSNKAFDIYLHDANSDFSLTNDKVSCFFSDNSNEIWIGTGNGSIDKFNIRQNNFQGYSYSDNYPSQTIQGIFRDPNDTNQLYITGWGVGLLKFDRKSTKFTNLMQNLPASDYERFKNIKGFGMDVKGNIWLASHTSAGLIIFDPETNKFYDSINPGPYKKNVLKIQYAVSMFQDSKNRIWIPTYVGLYMIDKSLHEFFTTTKVDSTISSNYIYAVYEDSKHNIWIGSAQGLDLVVESKNGISFTRISKKYGLPDNVKIIIEDNKGFIWLGSNDGIIKFNPSNKLWQQYKIQNNEYGNEFFERSGIKTKDGLIFFGGTSGMIKFHPDSLDELSLSPNLIISDFQIFNHSVYPGGKSPLNKAIYEADTIVLKYNENVISFEFTALNYKMEQKFEYAYQMQGFDKSWYNIGEKNFVTFTNLNHGTYFFKVRIANLTKDPISEKTICVIIKPPFWQTKLAYATYVLFFILLLLGFRQSILYREKLKNEIEREKIEANNIRETSLMKLRFFTNISHEFRTPLTLIKAPLEKLLESHESMNTVDRNYFYELIYKNTNKLSKMINQLMDYRKLEAGSLFLEPSQGDIVSFCKSIFDEFQTLALQKKITFKFHSAIESQNMTFDSDKLEKIISNILSNAFKFTSENGTITLNIKKKNRQNIFFDSICPHVIIQISDTGAGIPSEDIPHIFERFFSTTRKQRNESITGTGIGLTLVKELTELHKGEISVVSTENKGSTFTVAFPVILQEKIHSDSHEAVDDNNKKASTVIVVDSIIEENIEGSKINTLSKILIVEDDNDLRDFLVKEMSLHFRVFEAKDGLEGLEIANNHAPDIILSDVIMPDMDGIEFCRQIKTNENTSHLPVVLLTARYSEDKQLEALRTGADDYILKPFKSKVLIEKLNNLLKSRRELIEKFRQSSSLFFENDNIEEKDKELMQDIIDIILKNISDEKINADYIAQKIHISRSLVYLKIEALTGQTVNEFIRNIRLKKAKLLLAKKMSVTDVAYAVGFSSQSYFTRSFTQLFGISPKNFSKQ
jgi:signal transduction histidine kinase/ligand-binding sensor domain-containing protein/CheY-like chemotaxis protein/AraC-like DNA-binding protein